ncbi:unnamed protein product [Moneuplotes crassus]|uniref:Uncharacterized protein n=1 Tax=Euplotes crassus TaxID=5936 RepID=A0AAD1XTR1_EUPCR|nr:unnamed protein product [Moneuplotes crassus]
MTQMKSFASMSLKDVILLKCRKRRNLNVLNEIKGCRISRS